MRLRCDSCGNLAPDVVAPILHGQHGWEEFEIDGEHKGRRWTASVLLCDGGNGHKRTGNGCASRMRAFVESGGQHGAGPQPPQIRSCRGGQQVEPDYAERAA